MKKILKLTLCAALSATVIGSAFICGADSPSYAPYSSYELNESEESVAAPIGFTQSALWTAESIGAGGTLAQPQDFKETENGFVILDSGNSRIIETDKQGKLVKCYNSFRDENGGEVTFTEAQGIAINKDGNFLVSDTKNGRILNLDRNGILKGTITRPDEAMQDSDAPFQVSKIECAENGDIYVAVESVNLGIFVFDSSGKFDRFVASNPVVTTASVILNYLSRPFMTTEQIRNRMQSTPLKVTNFCLDGDGFIYTVSQNSKQVLQSGMVRRLNYRDSNVLSSEIVFGDLERDSENGKVTLFNSVAVTDNDDIILLDQSRGKVFYYSKGGYLMTVFGAIGDQDGTFASPIQVKYSDGKIYVLDSAKGCITEFKPTSYMTAYLEAMNLLNKREFDASLEKWKEVNRLNSNSSYAYYGMGLVHDMTGNYKEAMRCFKLADNKAAFSNSFKEYRKEFLSRWAWWLVLGIVAAVVLITFAVRFTVKALEKRNGEVYSTLETKWLFPFYTIRHPIDGFEQFKTRKIQSLALSGVIVVIWILTEFLSVFCTGYIFSGNSAAYNPFSTVLSTIGLFSVFVASNWCLSTLTEGKGTFSEIVSVTAYSLLPYIFSKLIIVLLSNVLCSNEQVFMTIISVIGLLWSAVLLLGGLYAIHQYSFGKTLFSVLLTLIGMLIIVLVFVVFYTLIQQAFGFIHSLYQEATL